MPSIPGYSRMTKTQRFSAAGISAVGAAALALTLVPGADAESGAQASPAADSAHVRPVAFAAHSEQSRNIDKQQAAAEDRAEHESAVKAKKEARKAAKAKAEKERRAQAEKKERAARKAERAELKTYPDNLDGWIRESLDIMEKKGIPGSYEGIKRNIMRESGGDPQAVNNTDVNAQNGTPSKGLLQVIQPTFDSYHVEGTPSDLTDPVANIVAACNYAAATYGSMDNVDSAY